MKRREIPKLCFKELLVLARELIFVEKTHLPQRITMREFSRSIQVEFIKRFRCYKQNLRDELHGELSIMIADMNGIILDKIEMPKREIIKIPLSDDIYKNLPDIEFLELLKSALHADDGVYSSFGFTPKLSLHRETTDRLQMGLNCFGIASLIGSYCTWKGISVELGITPDHPYAVVSLKEGVYLVDHFNLIKLDGEIKRYKDYGVYYPTEKEEGKILAMIMVVPFDDGLVYEILENTEMLRCVLNGTQKDMLPGTECKGKIIAKENETILNRCNWKQLQMLLFPEITAAFAKHQLGWQLNVSMIYQQRYEWYAQKIFEYAAFHAQKATLFSSEKFDEAHEVLVDVFKDHYEEIMLYLEHGMEFSEFVPLDVCNYFCTLKVAINKKEQEDGTLVAEHIYKMINTKLVDMNIQKKYKETNLVT